MAKLVGVIVQLGTSKILGFESPPRCGRPQLSLASIQLWRRVALACQHFDLGTLASDYPFVCEISSMESGDRGHQQPGDREAYISDTRRHGARRLPRTRRSGGL